MRIYGPLVYRWCRDVPLQPQDAADVAQVVFSAVHLKIGGFSRDQPGATFRGWLWTVTRNKVRDHFRSLADSEQAAGGNSNHQQLAQLGELFPEQEPDDAVSDEDIVIRAVELLKAEFETKTWDAFWRAVVQKEPVAEIAEEMGMSTWAVYQAKSRVLRRARKELADLIPLDLS